VTQSHASIGSYNVLVAEDNPHHQILILRLLNQLGLGADLVEDGVSVLGAVARKRYHLLLLDLNMPLMDGFEVARSLVKQYPRTRRPVIIAVTANIDAKARERCLEAGMDEYLPKPISLDDLRSALGGFGFVTNDEDLAPRSTITSGGLPLEMLNRLDLLVAETDPDFVVELINTYVDHGWPAIAEIERARRALDWEALHYSAHALKGSSRNLGAEELAKALEAIEQIAGSRRGEEEIDPEKLKQLFERTIMDLRRYKESLAVR
jgi:two-component system sensor histidine kinase/response regulator